jgi:hypothetical protein
MSLQQSEQKLKEGCWFSVVSMLYCALVIVVFSLPHGSNPVGVVSVVSQRAALEQSNNSMVHGARMNSVLQLAQ